MIHSSPDQSSVTGYRIEYVDALRVTATMMVICIHVAAQLLGGLPGSKTWLFGNLLDSISRPAVPLFLMISGMLLLSPDRILPIWAFFRRRFIRVIIPLLFWSLIYFLWASLPNGLSPVWSSFLPNLLSGTVYYHLGFLYALIGLYLIVPVVQNFTCVAKERDYIYLISLWIFSIAITPFLSRFFGVEISYYFRPIAGYLGYFVAGYYFSKIRPIRFRYILIILFIALAVIFFGTFILSKKSGALDQFFYDYLSLPCIAAAFALFLLFKQLPFDRLYNALPNLKKLILLASSVSFSIFLIHLIIMETLQYGRLGITLKANTFTPLFGAPISILVIFIVSLGIALVMRRIPGLRLVFQ